VAAKKFPHQALHPVPPDGFAQTLGDHQTQAGALAGGQDDAEMRRVHLSSAGLGRQVFSPPAKPIRLAETGLPLAGGGVEGSGPAGFIRGVAQGGLPVVVTPLAVCGLWPGGA
jgi:hypothetical protein